MANGVDCVPTATFIIHFLKFSTVKITPVTTLQISKITIEKQWHMRFRISPLRPFKYPQNNASYGSTGAARDPR